MIVYGLPLKAPTSHQLAVEVSSLSKAGLLELLSSRARRQAFLDQVRKGKDATPKILQQRTTAARCG